MSYVLLTSARNKMERKSIFLKNICNRILIKFTVNFCRTRKASSIPRIIVKEQSRKKLETKTPPGTANTKYRFICLLCKSNPWSRVDSRCRPRFSTEICNPASPTRKRGFLACPTVSSPVPAAIESIGTQACVCLCLHANSVISASAIGLCTMAVVGLKQASLAALQAAHPDLRLPAHRVSAPAHYVCHIGVGAFHRGHQALYLQQVNDQLPGLFATCPCCYYISILYTYAVDFLDLIYASTLQISQLACYMRECLC